jgi:ethanolamine-phosphate cytidylyltransferase
LIVGIHGDAVVNRRRGVNLPIMNLNERVLSVLGCKYVSDVLIDAPLSISSEMIASLNISEVARGSCTDGMGLSDDKETRYGHVVRTGIFAVIPSPRTFNIRDIIRRIQQNQEKFQSRFERKTEIESQFFRTIHDQQDT